MADVEGKKDGGWKWVVDAEEVEKSGDPVELARILVREVSKMAHAPVSGYHVGTALRGGSGAIYLGVNLEFGSMNGDTVHAEQFATTLAFLHGEQHIEFLMTEGGKPCGHCRQFISEVMEVDKISFLAARDKKLNYSMNELLPFGMRPSALTHTPVCVPIGSRMSDCHYHLFGPKQHRNLKIESSTLEDSFDDDTRVRMAIAQTACARSHAPYSGNLAGVAIVCDSENQGNSAAVTIPCFSGCVVENVAFNPTLPPLQVALIAAIAAMASHDRPVSNVLASISTAILMEKGDRLSWGTRTQYLLKELAPDAVLLKFKVVETE